MSRADAEVLMLFKQCLDLQPAEQEALLHTRPDLAQAVRQLLDADNTLQPVEDGFGLGALSLLAASEDADEDDILPTAIGPYRVLRVAGTGATSIVYEAMEAVPRRRVAVKVARATLDPQHHDRFRAEADALSQVRHPAIPVVFQVGQMSGLPWLAVEWVEGQALADAPERWTLTDLALVADGLDAAHEQQVFHGDISPSNLLHTESGPKIVDFGHTTSLESVASGGTPGFMAPDHATAAQRDQYALAQVLRLCHPHPSRTLAAVVEAGTSMRYARLHAMGKDLRAVADDQPVSVLRDSPWQAFRRSSRRHRRRWLVAGTTLGLVSIGMSLTWQVRATQRAAEQAAHYADAAADLDSLLATYTTDSVRQRALTDWLADPRWAGTPSTSRAWLERATLLQGRGELEEAAEAAGRAMVLAVTPEQQAAAAGSLAELFTLQGQWSSLARLADEVVDPRADLWRWRVAVATRDLPTAVELSIHPEVAALLTSWQQATRTVHRAAVARTLGDGVVLANQLEGKLVWAHLSPDLGERDALATRHAVSSYFVDRDLLLTRLGPGRVLLSRMEVTGETLRIVDLHETDQHLISATHLDGADARLLIGTGPPSRSILWADDLTNPPHPATNATHSDVTELLHLRTPGGDERVVAAVGPWTAYDLRVFAPTETGDLTLLDRVEMGAMEGLSTYNHDGEQYIVALKSDNYPNSEVFGSDSPSGRPFGIYQFALQSDQLQLRQFTSLDHLVPPRSSLRASRVGDLDGDGDVDLVAVVGVPDKTQMLVQLTTPDGPQLLLIDDVHPMAIANVDEDPSQELIVRLNDDDYATWVLGAGTDTLPVHLLPDSQPTAVAAPEDVQTLQRLGLDRAAAATAESRAARSDDANAVHLLQIAAASWLRFGDTQRAIGALSSALEHTPTEPRNTEVRQQLARLLMEELRIDEARAVVQSLPPRARPENVTDAPEMTSWSLRSDWAGWHLSAVDALRTPAAPDVVHLDISNTTGLLAETELEWSGDTLIIEYTTTIRQLELGSGIEVTLVRGTEQWLKAGILSEGGASNLEAIGRCHTRQGDIGARWPIINPLDMDDVVTMWLRINQRTGVMDCKVQRNGSLIRSASLVTDPPDGTTTRLQVASTHVTTDAMTRAVVQIERLEVRGADHHAPVPSELDAAHTALLRGDYTGAADAYHALGRDDLAALSKLDGGDPSAAEWFARHPDHALTQRLHRVRPEVSQALHAADPVGYPTRLVHDLGSASRYVQAGPVRALLLHPALASLDPRDAATCDVLRYRAQAYAWEGRLGASLATLQRIADASTMKDLEQCQVTSLLDAARVLAEDGRLDEARSRVHEAISRSSTPDLVRERAPRRPALEFLNTP